MDKETALEMIECDIENAMQAMFPHGAGQTNHTRVRHWLDKIAQIAFNHGRSYALLGLITANDVALHYNITERRARALIANRHQRFGIGMKLGNSWLLHRDELQQLQPDDKYHQK